MSERDDPYDLAARAAAELDARFGPHDVALVVGSGWATAAGRVGVQVDEMPAHELTGVPAPTVLGHDGVLRSVRHERGDAEPLAVLVVAGRSHLYEGHDPATVVHAVRAAVLNGARTVVLTNAAGSLRPEVGIGVVVAISDQLNLTGENPLTGPAPPDRHPARFVDLTDLYSARLRAALAQRRPGSVEGVYAGLLGGAFETPAEIRMLGILGADLVGMSTVLESIAARHLGAEVVGLSLVTNLAAGLQATLDHLEVLEAGEQALDTMVDALVGVLDSL